MAMSKKLKGLLTNSEGVVAIIVALLLVAFIGMTALVVDMGSLYEDRTSLQSVADAAALAGAQELPQSPSMATQVATDYITTNRADIDSINILISSTLAPNDTITATVNNPDSPIRFGSVYGPNSANVAATATAIVGKPKIVSGIVPWGVLEDEWVPGQPYTLKTGPPSTGGNFQALAPGDSSGANDYKYNIINGVDISLQVGDWINTETGNMVGPTIQGTGSRIYDESDYTLNTFDELTDPYYDADGNFLGFRLTRADSQYVMCPIIEALPPHGSSDPVQILAFIPFIITSYSGTYVTGTFLNEALIVSTGGIDAVDETGLKVIRLIQ